MSSEAPVPSAADLADASELTHLLVQAAVRAGLDPQTDWETGTAVLLGDPCVRLVVLDASDGASVLAVHPDPVPAEAADRVARVANALTANLPTTSVRLDTTGLVSLRGTLVLGGLRPDVDTLALLLRAVVLAVATERPRVTRVLDRALAGELSDAEVVRELRA